MLYEEDSAGGRSCKKHASGGRSCAERTSRARHVEGQTWQRTILVNGGARQANSTDVAWWLISRQSFSNSSLPLSLPLSPSLPRSPSLSPSLPLSLSPFLPLSSCVSRWLRALFGSSCAALAELLRRAPRLTQLDLSHNRLAETPQARSRMYVHVSSDSSSVASTGLTVGSAHATVITVCRRIESGPLCDLLHALAVRGRWSTLFA